MQIKTITTCYLTPVRMTVTKKTRNNKRWWRCGEKEANVHSQPQWWECKLVRPLWKTVWRFLKKWKIELLYGLAIPLLGIYLKKMKTLNSKWYMHPYAHCSFIYNSQGMETTWVSISGWMDDEIVRDTHIHNGISLSQEWNLAICNNMDGPGGQLCKVR